MPKDGFTPGFVVTKGHTVGGLGLWHMKWMESNDGLDDFQHSSLCQWFEQMIGNAIFC